MTKLYPWTDFSSNVRDPNTDKNAAIYAETKEAFERRIGPCVGDIVLMKDGSRRRFTYKTTTGMQTTCKTDAGHYSSGSFNIDRLGFVSFSGTLDPPVSFDKLELQPVTEEAEFWFFDGDTPGAHRAIYVDIPCRVYRETD